MPRIRQSKVEEPRAPVVRRSSEEIDCIPLLPANLTDQEKSLSTFWQVNCYCCPSEISLARCILALEEPDAELSIKAHYALNVLGFREDKKAPLAQKILLKAGLVKILQPLLQCSEAHGGSDNDHFVLRPGADFARQYGSPHRLKFRTTVQVASVELLTWLLTGPVAPAVIKQNPALLQTVIDTARSTQDAVYATCALRLMNQLLCSATPMPRTEAASSSSSPGQQLTDELAADMVQRGVVDLVMHVLRSFHHSYALCEAAVLATTLCWANHWHYFAFDSRCAVVIPRCQSQHVKLFYAQGIEQALSAVLQFRPSQLQHWGQCNFRVVGTPYLDMQASCVGCLRALLSSHPSICPGVGDSFMAGPVAQKLLADPVTSAALASNDGTGTSAAEVAAELEPSKLAALMVVHLRSGRTADGTLLKDLPDEERHCVPELRLEAATCSTSGEGGWGSYWGEPCHAPEGMRQPSGRAGSMAGWT